ncbi:MAG: cytochrome c oxidase accessory protein CcoG [Motiliproteus sp.]|nr:cytochrome c oxidase accessory protein CcoG [Motiliproteus sp.]MCW9051203.1 cytochrome c oxidase accessory protein CcoG [Motiliproteus sp.]
MTDSSSLIAAKAVEDIYTEVGQWHVNVGEEKIHPKRMPGRWRNIKWWSSSVWLIFFLGPYLRWGDRQAVLFDLPSQKFYLFGLTVLPQDLWILSLILLFFAILLAVVTAVAGRVFCGFFCFQTVWTDIYVAIEEWLEGSPRQRQKLDEAKWGLNKIRTKGLKHLLWLLIGLITGISFVAWFMDAQVLWQGLWSLSLPSEAVITISAFVVGTYTLAGFMREQTCLWLCPYSRIQGVMVDQFTVLPAYDVDRGEPRGRRRKEALAENLGDCIDCNLCVAVCPTGVDIRQGQQQGCITCALCIDACDSVMDKLGRPRGLIRYDSLNGLEGQKQLPWYKRGRVWTYLSILTFAVVGGSYGLATLDALELKVIQKRQPLYVTLSDGSIQNRYRLKILNKVDKSMEVVISAKADAELMLIGADKPVAVTASGVTAHDLFVRVPKGDLAASTLPLTFSVKSIDSRQWYAEREAVFIAPASVDKRSEP